MIFSPDLGAVLVQRDARQRGNGEPSSSLEQRIFDLPSGFPDSGF